MIADRSYTADPLPDYDDPPEPTILPFVRPRTRVRGRGCPCCDGLGYKRFFDADTGWAQCACMACGGRATAGSFVIHVQGERFAHELTWFGDDFARGLERLTRLAAHLAGRRCLGQFWLEARLVYQSHDPDWRTPEGDASEVVAVVRLSRFPRGPY